jgi:hypothetical protein
LGLAITQIAAFGSREGLVEIGQAVAWLSAGSLLGLMIGRNGPMTRVSNLGALLTLVGVALMVFSTQPLSAVGAAEENEVPLLTGELQITLIWNGDADLDLWVREPGTNGSGGSTIYYQVTSGAQGGVLDRDDNAGCTGPPANYGENVAWPAGTPTGRFEIWVDHFCSPDESEDPQAFRLEIRTGGELAVIDSGRLSDGSRSESLIVEVARGETTGTPAVVAVEGGENPDVNPEQIGGDGSQLTQVDESGNVADSNADGNDISSGEATASAAVMTAGAVLVALTQVAASAGAGGPSGDGRSDDDPSLREPPGDGPTSGEEPPEPEQPDAPVTPIGPARPPPSPEDPVPVADAPLPVAETSAPAAQAQPTAAPPFQPTQAEIDAFKEQIADPVGFITRSAAERARSEAEATLAPPSPPSPPSPPIPQGLVTPRRHLGPWLDEAARTSFGVDDADNRRLAALAEVASAHGGIGSRDEAELREIVERAIYRGIATSRHEGQQGDRLGFLEGLSQVIIWTGPSIMTAFRNTAAFARFAAATFVSGWIGFGDSAGRAMVGTRDQAEGGAAAGFGRGMATNAVSNALDVAAPGAGTLLGQAAIDYAVGAGGSIGGEVSRDLYDSVTGTDSSGGRSLGERVQGASDSGLQNVVGSAGARVFHARRPGSPATGLVAEPRHGSATAPTIAPAPTGRMPPARNPGRGAGIPEPPRVTPRKMGAPQRGSRPTQRPRGSGRGR